MTKKVELSFFNKEEKRHFELFSRVKHKKKRDFGTGKKRKLTGGQSENLMVECSLTRTVPLLTEGVTTEIT